MTDDLRERVRAAIKDKFDWLDSDENVAIAVDNWPDSMADAVLEALSKWQPNAILESLPPNAEALRQEWQPIETAPSPPAVRPQPSPPRLIISSEPWLPAIDIPIVATASDWAALSSVLASLATVHKGSHVATVATEIHRQIDRIVIANLQPDAPEGGAQS